MVGAACLEPLRGAGGLELVHDNDPPPRRPPPPPPPPPGKKNNLDVRIRFSTTLYLSAGFYTYFSSEAVSYGANPSNWPELGRLVAPAGWQWCQQPTLADASCTAAVACGNGYALLIAGAVCHERGYRCSLACRVQVGPSARQAVHSQRGCWL